MKEAEKVCDFSSLLITRNLHALATIIDFLNDFLFELANSEGFIYLLNVGRDGFKEFLVVVKFIVLVFR